MEKYVICQECGKECARIFGKHLKMHGMTSQEYKEKYPDKPLMCESDKMNLIKYAGAHMKQEKYKKMFSEKIKGEKNPNHKSKTTEEQRKERSPFCLDFHKDEEKLINFRIEALSDREFAVRLEYYLDKGYDLETSKKMLKNRQTTFSLELCMEKYGEIDGVKKFTERQEKWLKTLNNNGNMCMGFSKISQELFYKILEYYVLEDRKDIYFATKNEEYKIQKINGGFWLYDFTDLKNKKIIEYNGDLFHANPEIYESNDTPNPYRNKQTSEDIWKKDNIKKETAELNGFKVLTIWDSEYKKDNVKILKKCIDFLK